MSIYFSYLPLKQVGLFITLVAWCIAFGSESIAASENKVDSVSKKTVFIDPGHGGHDTGAKGPDGGVEKLVVFDLAKALATDLAKHYDCLLTRTDDYSLPLVNRSEAANHAGADLFISLHTGGSYRHQSNGMSIFYYQVNETRGISNNDTLADSGRRTRWSHVQHRHLSFSRQLANHVQGTLQAQGRADSCRVIGAPMVVLSGLDMPAILIEFGYITNPSEEQRMKDPAYLTQLAHVIGDGIRNFFTNQSTIFSIDLRE